MTHSAIAIIAFICLLTSAGGLDAQTAKKEYPEPEFNDKLYYYDEEKNELSDAERGLLTEDSRTSSFTSQESFYFVNGEKSAFRIKKGQKICFMLKWYNDHLDPNAYYTLMKMNYNPRKKRREIVLEQTSTMVHSSKQANVKVYYKTKKVKETKDQNNSVYVLRLFILDNLEPGEYVWKYERTDALFFGVDE
ncbi:MAG: hypothetical protein ACXVP0_06220 [Bacteroidia bacterium]